MRLLRSSDMPYRRRIGFGFLRAMVLAGLILAITISVSLRRADAHLGESLIAFGDQLSAFTGGRLQSKEGHLSINGVLLHRVTASTPLSIEETLDRLTRVCAENGGVEGAEKLLAKTSTENRASTRTLLQGVYRHETSGQGVLACIDTGRPLALKELTERLGTLTKTGDLSALGHLRYVLAKREGEVTSLLVLWTDGSAPVLRMFPKTGDAPGRDVPDVPRPEKARRLLSAADLGAPYSITVYRSSSSPEALQRWYVEALAKGAWRVTEVNASTLVARRGERHIVVRTRLAREGQTTASIVELS